MRGKLVKTNCFQANCPTNGQASRSPTARCALSQPERTSRRFPQTKTRAVAAPLVRMPAFTGDELSPAFDL